MPHNSQTELERVDQSSRSRELILVSALAFLVSASIALPVTADDEGERLYQAACASCHGLKGRGTPAPTVGFSEPLPDFTDCSFSTREPDADWFAIAHEGGPVRGFASMMPAFGDALEPEAIQMVLGHVRSFCQEPAWPRGELNLPRALVTEKAYPEDEAVLDVSVSTASGADAITGKLVYEKRFGARNQYELVVPFAWREGVASHAAGSWVGGLGDLGFAVKRVLHHDHETGRIFSVISEVTLPTGNEDEGFGKGTTVVEPFVAFGQVLPGDAFLQVQAGLELPLEDGDGDDEALLRWALGRSFTQGRFGRTWSPILEVLGARELGSGASAHWSLVPQLQVTLNRRQHVAANLGARIPLDGSETVEAVLVYVLWDWFDGGLLDGW